jgi:hypothetical protein
MDAVLAGTTEPDRANAWKGLVSEFIKITGFAAPTKSISANVNMEQQVIPTEQQLEYLNAFAGLYEDERLEELDKVKARKRTCRVVMDANAFQKQLPDGGTL